MGDTPENWLANLKEGDTVIYDFDNRSLIRKVTKVTKTQIHVHGKKFRRSDGWEVGEEWSKIQIRFPDPAEVIQVNETNLRAFYAGRIANLMESQDIKVVSAAKLKQVFEELSRLAVVHAPYQEPSK